MAQLLAQFSITKSADESFMLHIEDEAGTTIELEATYDQLDLIAESIEEHLENDLEDPDLVDDEATNEI